MIKAIFFDCFGVLTTDTWKAFLSKLPKDVDIEKTRQIHRDYDAGLISKKESAQQIRSITGRPFIELEDALDQTPTKNMPLLDYIKQLKKHYKIGIISNIGNNWIKDFFLTEYEQELFDDMVFSFEAGTTKPDPNIYKLSCERLGVNLNEAILIDDVDRYCVAAEQLGMKAIIYKDFKQMEADLKNVLSQS